MKYFLIFFSFFFFIQSSANSDTARQIIGNLEKAKNYSFKFVQKINENEEKGNCVLVFDRKINCKYENNGKILISDGKSLIIKSRSSNIPNFYKLKDTYFYKILEKKYIINQLSKTTLKKEDNNNNHNNNKKNNNIKKKKNKHKIN